MTVTERVAYLKGLYEGLGIDGDKKEGKLLKGMLDTLADLAETVTETARRNAEMSDELDDVYEELSSLQEEFYGWDEDDDDDLDFDPNEDLYQVICPTCGESLFIDEETLDKGGVKCPACGEELEFDLSALYDEELDEDLAAIDGVPETTEEE